jgi:hypothetical protein
MKLVLPTEYCPINSTIGRAIIFGSKRKQKCEGQQQGVSHDRLMA